MQEESDSISGLELIEKMKEQAIKNTELHEMEEVEEIIQNDGEYRFTVKTSKGEYQSKTVILATGSSHRHLDAKGEEEFKGKGVSYCATCDGFFFAGRDNGGRRKQRTSGSTIPEKLRRKRYFNPQKR